jgi:hypothetical protein
MAIGTKRELWMVKENGGDGHEFLSDSKDYRESFRKPKQGEVTAEALAEMMDQDMESENHHSFVGVHAALVGILKKSCGPNTRKLIMRRIYDRGGLAEMAS